MNQKEKSRHELVEGMRILKYPKITKYCVQTYVYHYVIQTARYALLSPFRHHFKYKKRKKLRKNGQSNFKGRCNVQHLAHYLYCNVLIQREECGDLFIELFFPMMTSTVIVIAQ